MNGIALSVLDSNQEGHTVFYPLLSNNARAQRNSAAVYPSITQEQALYNSETNAFVIVGGCSAGPLNQGDALYPRAKVFPSEEVTAGVLTIASTVNQRYAAAMETKAFEFARATVPHTAAFGQPTLGGLQWMNKPAIEMVFAEAPTLRILLQEAIERLRLFFAEGLITVETSSDPDEPGPTTLVLRIKTCKAFGEARAAWKHFNEEWWLPNYYRGENRVCILLDF